MTWGEGRRTARQGRADQSSVTSLERGAELEQTGQNSEPNSNLAHNRRSERRATASLDLLNYSRPG